MNNSIFSKQSHVGGEWARVARPLGKKKKKNGRSNLDGLIFPTVDYRPNDMHPRNKLNKDESRKIYLEESPKSRMRTSPKVIIEKMSTSNKCGSTSTRETSEVKATI